MSKAAVKEREPANLRAAPKPKPAAKPTGKPKPAANAVAVRKPTPAAAPVNMLAVIARAAADPNCQPSKMRELLDMQKELAAEEARVAFIQAFGRMKLPEIRTDGRIEIKEKVGGVRSGPVQQSTPYATFQNIMRTVKPSLDANGFTLSFATEPTADGSRIIVHGFLDHERGHRRSTAFPLPAETSGSKNNAQGWGSAFSYGKRYCTIALLNLVSNAKEDADLDGATTAPATGELPAKQLDETVVDPTKPINAEQIKAVNEAIAECGVPLATFCEKYGITKVAELPAVEFKNAKLACQKYAAANPKAKAK